jgi:hypothetical protein
MICLCTFLCYKTEFISQNAVTCLYMCGICTLPTTHANTFSTISMVSLCLLVFWTFVWAWWGVTKIRVENFFVNMFYTTLKVRPGEGGHILRRILLASKKHKLLLALIFISVGILFWAGLSDQRGDSRIKLPFLEPYYAVPVVNPPDTNMLQLDTL